MIMIDYRRFNQSLIRLYKFNLIIIMIAQHEASLLKGLKIVFERGFGAVGRFRVRVSHAKVWVFKKLYCLKV